MKHNQLCVQHHQMENCQADVHWVVASLLLAHRGAEEDPLVEDPQVEDLLVEGPQVEDPQVEDPQLEDPQVEEPQVEDFLVEDPQEEDPLVEDPLVVVYLAQDSMGHLPQPCCYNLTLTTSQGDTILK